MQNQTLFWLISSCIFLCIEIGTPGLFYFLSFFCGSICAALMSYLCFSLIDQGVIFLLSSIICFFVLKGWVKRYGVRGHYQSNIYALQGKRGPIVTPPAAQKFGYVYIDGELWACRSDDVSIQAGHIVEVIAVRGVHVLVTKIKHS